jgi:hypothetical protein
MAPRRGWCASRAGPAALAGQPLCDVLGAALHAGLASAAASAAHSSVKPAPARPACSGRGRRSCATKDSDGWKVATQSRPITRRASCAPARPGAPAPAVKNGADGRPGALSASVNAPSGNWLGKFASTSLTTSGANAQPVTGRAAVAGCAPASYTGSSISKDGAPLPTFCTSVSGAVSVAMPLAVAAAIPARRTGSEAMSRPITAWFVPTGSINSTMACSPAWGAI